MSNGDHVNLFSLRNMFWAHQAETGRMPARVHLTKSQISMLAKEAEELGVKHEGSRPQSVWGVEIIECDTGPHLVD